MRNPPMIVAWEFTNKCNLYCIHCALECSIDSNFSELTTEEALNLCDQMADLKVERVALSGGEPLLRSDWATIVDRLNHLGIKVSISTNGTLIDEKMIEKLILARPESVCLSLDGATPEIHDYIRGRKGSFEKTLNAINLLLEARIFTAVGTTLQRINIHQLDLIKKIILLNGVDAWKIQMALPHGRMNKKITITENQFYEVTKYISRTSRHYKNLFVTGGDFFGYFGTLQNSSSWNGCHAGINALAVLCDGTVKGCPTLPVEIPSEGNFRERSLIEIWNDPNAFPFNRKFNPEMLDGYCKECVYGEVCRGGCSERAFSFTGNVCNNPYCNYKFEQKGLSSKEQAVLNFDPEETKEIYNSIRPLPEDFNLQFNNIFQV